MAPVVQPASSRVPMPMPWKRVCVCVCVWGGGKGQALRTPNAPLGMFTKTYHQNLWCRTAWRSRRGRFGPRRSSSVSGAPPPGRCRGSWAPRCAPWWRWCQTSLDISQQMLSLLPGSLLGSARKQLGVNLSLPTTVFAQGVLTCRRTLAVSRGKVSRSAMQAAVPAPTNFTAAEGGTSAGPNPTMFGEYWQLH